VAHDLYGHAWREAGAHLADDRGVLALELVDGVEGLRETREAHRAGERARGALGAQEVAAEQRARGDAYFERARVALDALVHSPP
jgi:hypothetical protein